jgi:hypothetical protein
MYLQDRGSLERSSGELNVNVEPQSPGYSYHRLLLARRRFTDGYGIPRFHIGRSIGTGYPCESAVLRAGVGRTPFQVSGGKRLRSCAVYNRDRSSPKIQVAQGMLIGAPSIESDVNVGKLTAVNCDVKSC